MLALLLLACHVPPDPPVARPWDGVRIHLTIDDAPVHGTGDAATINPALRAALAARGVEASVFFNCARTTPEDGEVEAWAAAGHTVGNHTSTHAGLHRVPLEAWVEDARSCHDALAARLGAPPRWFRHPYLHEGDTPEKKQGARDALAALGERNAPVTAATSEWILAAAWDATTDPSRRAAVAADYPAHLVASLEEARRLAALHTDGEVPQVLLVHANALAAAHLGDVLDVMAGRGARFVGIEEALAHPLYARPDGYVGRAGLSHWARLDLAAAKPYWFGLEEGRLEERYAWALGGG